MTCSSFWFSCAVPAPGLVWEPCKLSCTMGSQCAGIPWGFPSDLTPQPSCNSGSAKRRDLSFGCLFPFAFSGVKLSPDLLWSFPRLAQSPCLPNYWMEETAREENDLFLDDDYPGQCKDWLRSCVFVPCHSNSRLGCKVLFFFFKGRRLNNRMMQI